MSYPENLTIGENVDIGAFTYINAKYGVFISNNVKIGPHCAILTDNSIFEVFLTVL